MKKPAVTNILMDGEDFEWDWLSEPLGKILSLSVYFLLPAIWT